MGTTAGTRGPIPKRSTEQAGHNAKSERPDRISVGGPVEQPDEDLWWHPLAAAWYTSLANSGQSRFYEPSDWALAKIIATILSDQLLGRISSEMMKTLLADMGKLGTTEADRRRMRIEVERQSSPTNGVAAAEVAVLEQFRSRGSA